MKLGETMLKKNVIFKRLVQCTLLAPLVLGASSALAEYPNVTIKNYAPHEVVVLIDYASAFCSNDTLTVPKGKLKKGQEDRIEPGTKTAPGSRGVCLVSYISGGGLDSIQE
jgi:hypothetical protein